MGVTMYAIPNCDTVKKARTWLDDHGIAYDFHDYKKSGAPMEMLKAWVTQFGWETVLNRAGLTFKKLPDTEKQSIDAAKAIALMTAQTSMIKRPILVHNGGTLIGFKPDDWKEAMV